MASRSELDALLRQLELDIPFMVESEGSNGFFRVFEDRSEMILVLAETKEHDYVMDCLMIMLRKALLRVSIGGTTLH